MEGSVNLSVIIPMYNAEKYIANTIASIQNQQKHSMVYEIIIVDDCSTDQSRQVVKDLNNDNIRLIELNENGGTSHARNAGIAAARGEWLQFVDSDDAICSDLYSKFEDVQRPLINCYVFSLIIEEHNQTIQRKIIQVKDKRAIGYFYAVWNFFIRKEICAEFNHISLQNEDVCFIVDMMNTKNLEVDVINDAYYILNRKNDASKMANFSEKEYLKMYNYVYGRIDHCDVITKMFILESFVGIVFSKGMPLLMSLRVAMRTIFKLFYFLPAVYSNGIRNCVKNTTIA